MVAGKLQGIGSELLSAFSELSEKVAVNSLERY